MENLTQPARLRIGKLDRRVTIRQVTETHDETGGVSSAWSDVATVWAAIEYPGTASGERYMAEQQTAFTRVNFLIRFRADVVPKMQIRYNSKDYDILTTEELTRLNYLKIICELLQ